jgi:hypothetical protein
VTLNNLHDDDRFVEKNKSGTEVYHPADTSMLTAVFVQLAPSHFSPAVPPLPNTIHETAHTQNAGKYGHNAGINPSQLAPCSIAKNDTRPEAWTRLVSFYVADSGSILV